MPMYPPFYKPSKNYFPNFIRYLLPVVLEEWNLSNRRAWYMSWFETSGAPQMKYEIDSRTEDKVWPKKGRMAGGRFDQQGNLLTRLVRRPQE